MEFNPITPGSTKKKKTFWAEKIFWDSKSEVEEMEDEAEDLETAGNGSESKGEDQAEEKTELTEVRLVCWG